MNNNDILISSFCVGKDNFNLDFIKNLGNVTYLKINDNYVLNKDDYNNLVIYSNVNTLDVYDIEDFDFGNEIKLNIAKKVSFNTDSYKKLNVDKYLGYDKTNLTINLPFNLYFIEDCLYSEEDDFDKLLKYINDIEILNIKFNSLDVVDKVISTIFKIEKKIGKKIKFINCITDNRTITDIEKLRFLEDGRIIKIWYEDGITDCSIDEFIVMRKYIDSILSSINNKLSNFEKVIYVYDIVKKFNYKSSLDNHSMDGRQLHKIFNTGNIVCSGFSRVITEVLNELGIRSGIYKLITKDNELHARSLVHIVDDKYNINAIYSMEPTWESAINTDYAYSLFLTPINKLKSAFPNEKFREDIDVLCGLKKLNDISLRDRVSLYQFFNNKDLEQSIIDEVISDSNRYVSLNDFCKALIRVRIEQGIFNENTNYNISNIIDYNNKLVNYFNVHMGTNINFFLD